VGSGIHHFFLHIYVHVTSQTYIVVVFYNEYMLLNLYSYYYTIIMLLNIYFFKHI